MKTGGQTLFELVIAIAVAIVVVTGIAAVVTLSLRNANFARDQAQATRFAQDGLEWLRSERDKDWDSFYSHTGTSLTWCLNNLGWTSPGACGTSRISGTFFSRWVEFSVVEPNKSLNVQVRVSWTDNQGTHQSRIDTVLVSNKANP